MINKGREGKRKRKPRLLKWQLLQHQLWNLRKVLLKKRRISLLC